MAPLAALDWPCRDPTLAPRSIYEGQGWFSVTPRVFYQYTCVLSSSPAASAKNSGLIVVHGLPGWQHGQGQVIKLRVSNLLRDLVQRGRVLNDFGDSAALVDSVCPALLRWLPRWRVGG